MNYSRKTPDATGWYWMKREGAADQVVYHTSAGALYLIGGPFMSSDIRTGDQFAGPIPRPGEGRSFNEVSSATHRKMNAKSVELAHSSGQPWTVDEIKVALDRSLTDIQAAARIGRTVYAVRTRRRNEKLKK